MKNKVGFWALLLFITLVSSSYAIPPFSEKEDLIDIQAHVQSVQKNFAGVLAEKRPFPYFINSLIKNTADLIRSFTDLGTPRAFKTVGALKTLETWYWNQLSLRVKENPTLDYLLVSIPPHYPLDPAIARIPMDRFLAERKLDPAFTEHDINAFEDAVSPLALHVGDHDELYRDVLNYAHQVQDIHQLVRDTSKESTIIRDLGTGVGEALFDQIKNRHEESILFLFGLMRNPLLQESTPMKKWVLNQLTKAYESSRPRDRGLILAFFDSFVQIATQTRAQALKNPQSILDKIFYSMAIKNLKNFIKTAARDLGGLIIFPLDIQISRTFATHPEIAKELIPVIVDELEKEWGTTESMGFEELLTHLAQQPHLDPSTLDRLKRLASRNPKTRELFKLNLENNKEKSTPSESPANLTPFERFVKEGDSSFRTLADDRQYYILKDALTNKRVTQELRSDFYAFLTEMKPSIDRLYLSLLEDKLFNQALNDSKLEKVLLKIDK